MHRKTLMEEDKTISLKDFWGRGKNCHRNAEEKDKESLGRNNFSTNILSKSFEPFLTSVYRSRALFIEAAFIALLSFIK